MKKILALLLIFAFAFSLASCVKYKPQKSTKEESRVLYELKDGKNGYDVKYELYRLFFLTYRDSIDGGDPTVWSGDNADTYAEKINALILDRVCEIYAVFALCDEIGIDLYSKETDKKVEELLAVSVEGGTYGGEYYEGFDSYDDYLAELKAAGGNYAVSDLLFRYAIGLTVLTEHYAGLGDGLGNLMPTDEELTAFFESDDTARILFLYFDRAIAEDNPARVTNIHDTIEDTTKSELSKEQKDDKITTYVLGQMSNMAEANVKSGEIVTAYTLDSVSYAGVADVIFLLSDGEVSELCDIVSDAFDGVYFIYRMSKPENYLTQNRDRVMDAYIADYCGEKLAQKKASLLESAKATAVLTSLSYADIQVSE